MKTVLILIALTALCFTSCSSCTSDNNKSATTSKPSASNYDNTLAKGKVIDSVICQNQTTQSYALYLPSNYSITKSFACIFFFDAHARGPLPVKLYKDLAEKYGFILISSNVSKNGIDIASQDAVAKVMMQDARTRINIDPHRIYTSGFSGGARVASYVAIFDGGVSGVVGCAAGFPTTDNGIPNKFDYFGMVGDYDFNLTEMERLDETLEQNGFSHQLFTFDGKHDWPAANDFQTALLWIQVNAMKENAQTKNDTIITALKGDYDKRVAAAKSSDDVLREHELLDGEVRVFNGLSDVPGYKTQLAALITSVPFKNAIANQAQIQQVEQNQQQILEHDFIEEDLTWWTKKIATMNESIHTSRNKQEAQMNQRLLNFLGLIGYLNSDHVLSAGDLEHAATYLKIYKLADPGNPDCSYLTAVFYMKKNDPKQAISSLNEAASLGYSEVSKLITDTVFNDLHNDGGFISVVARVRANSAAK